MRNIDMTRKMHDDTLIEDYNLYIVLVMLRRAAISSEPVGLGKTIYIDDTLF